MDENEIVSLNHAKPAFLLNFTKGGKPIQVESLKNIETWSIRHKLANVGDEVFLLMPNKGLRNPKKGTRGIVGRGEIVKSSYPMSEAAQWAVDVRIDDLIDPVKESILSLDELGLMHPQAKRWHRQPNGMPIPNEVAEVIRNSRQWHIPTITPKIHEPGSIPDTSSKREVGVRIGQQQFREKLLRYWNGCSVTGCSLQEVLIASHIVPWAEASNQERLDVSNGLLLTPNLDRLFDNYFISFNSLGEILISKSLDNKAISDLGITPSMKLRKSDEKLLLYLNKHEHKFFKKEQSRWSHEEISQATLRRD